MKVQTYLLGLLMNYGAQHGYNLRQFILRDISDFANIKTPTVYYHLEQLEKKDYVISSSEKGANKTDKKVYSITNKGEEYFFKNLYKLWNENFSFEFLIDGAFYFFKYFKSDEFVEKLKKYELRIEDKYENIRTNSEHVLSFLDKESSKMNEMIYYHHILHYEAELKWIKYVLKSLEESNGDI